MKETGRFPYRGRATNRQHRWLQRLLLIQLLLTFLIPSLLYLTVGWVPAYSGLLGGVIYLLPTAYQLRHFVAPEHSNNIRRTLRDLYKSEIWKMALTAVLFGVVFSTVRPLEPFSLFAVFVLLQCTSWLVALLNRPGAKR